MISSFRIFLAFTSCDLEVLSPIFNISAISLWLKPSITYKLNTILYPSGSLLIRLNNSSSASISNALECMTLEELYSTNPISSKLNLFFSRYRRQVLITIRLIQPSKEPLKLNLFRLLNTLTKASCSISSDSCTLRA